MINKKSETKSSRVGLKKRIAQNMTDALAHISVASPVI